RTACVRVDLPPDERDRYNADYAVYSGYIRSRQLLGRYRRDWFRELMRWSSRDPQARGALLARQRLLQLVGSCEGKFRALEALLQEYPTARVLVFTEHLAMVYAIAARYLIPAITHETRAAERKQIPDGRRAGRYRAPGTCRVPAA